MDPKKGGVYREHRHSGTSGCDGSWGQDPITFNLCAKVQQKSQKLQGDDGKCYLITADLLKLVISQLGHDFIEISV